jgi:hypothetical protein
MPKRSKSQRDGSAQNTGRTQNLKPWKPGQSGNPGGRPSQRPLTEAIMRQMERELGTTDKATILDAVARAFTKQLLLGDMVGIKELWCRLEGKVPLKLEQTIEHTIIDTSKLTDAQLAEAEKLIESAYPGSHPG